MEEKKYSIETFNQLFANHKGKFVHFARTYVNDIAMAEDIAIDSIIDYAYTLPEEQKDMCKTLIYAAIQYYRDTNDSRKIMLNIHLLFLQNFLTKKNHQAKAV